MTIGALARGLGASDTNAAAIALFLAKLGFIRLPGTALREESSR